MGFINGNNYHQRSFAISFSFVLLILVAGSPIFSFLTFRLTGKYIHVILLLLSLPAIFLLLIENEKLKIPTYLKFFLLFVLYTILSDAILVNKSINTFYLRNNRLIGSFLIMVVIENVQVTNKMKRTLYLITIVLFITAIIVMFIQQFHSASFFVQRDWALFQTHLDDVQLRLPSIYSWNENIMVFGLCFVPIFLIVLEEHFINKKDSKNLIYLITLFAFISVIFNRTRITIVLFLIALLLFPIYQGFNVRKVIKLTIILVTVVYSFILILKQTDSIYLDALEKRIFETDTRSIEETSAGSRILAFTVFAKLFPKNPWFGKGKLHGFGEHGSRDIDLLLALHHRSSQIHVGYLSLFYYYGFFGGLLFTLFLASLAIKLYRDAKKTGYWAPFLIWLMFLVNNLTDVYFYFNIMGILMALIFNRFYSTNLIQTEIDND